MALRPRLLACVLAAVAPCAAAASAAEAAAPMTPAARAFLAREMRAAGPYSGAIVMDASNGAVLFSWRPDTLRVPASNQKLFTTSTAFLRFGANGVLPTRALAPAAISSNGTLAGPLYIKGGGDPTFGTYAFAHYNYGTGATVTLLAARLAAAGLRRVQGQVLGDESLFDRLRGGRTFARDYYLGGSISALSFNRGLASGGAAYFNRPAAYAASQLTAALRARGIVVTGAPGDGLAPVSSSELARVTTSISTLAGLTNRPSDNFFAETLLKDLGGYFVGRGSTAAGAGVVRTQLGSMGIRPRVYDGSGLSRLNRTTPRQVARLLVAMNRSPTLRFAFSGSLAVAGRSGTLYSRMRVSVARSRCRGKTGTLVGVSALSGYCDTLGGRRLAFSILMNGVSVGRAHALQDAMTATVARDRGAPDRVAIPAARAAAARQ